MNILPKKRWHVRTKDNIARVRRDEAQAAEEEQERLRRVALAEQEFRTSILRARASERRKANGEAPDELPPPPEPGQSAAAAKRDLSIVSASGHINFFQHLEEGERTAAPNEEHLREQKEEKEKYEKSIGYLTYLGQGSREETKQKAWFETLPTDRTGELKKAVEDEVNRKAKSREDPLALVKRLTNEDGPVSSRQGPSGGVTGDVGRTHRVPAAAASSATSRKSGGSAAAAEASKSDSADRRHKKSSKRDKHDKHKKSKKRKHSRRKSERRSSEERSRSSSRKRRRCSASSSSSSSSSEGDGSSDEEEAAAARRVQLERLRRERLQREREERQRTEQLLSRLKGDQEPKQQRQEPARAAVEPRVTQRYNAQFNPVLARQNYRSNAR